MKFLEKKIKCLLQEMRRGFMSILKVRIVIITLVMTVLSGFQITKGCHHCISNIVKEHCVQYYAGVGE